MSGEEARAALCVDMRAGADRGVVDRLYRDADLQVFLFRSLRELLVNIARHASASNAEVCLRADVHSIHITVSDDGVGFVPPSPSFTSRDGGGFGLFNIREQLGLRSGSLQIESSPGSGTRVVLAAPLKRDVRTT